MDDKISNNHLIYSYTGLANESQIVEVIRDALIKAEIESDFYVNVVTRDNIPCNYSYIWVTNKQAFEYLISFKNLGYTTVKKMVTVDNPDYQPLAKSSSDMSYYELLNTISSDCNDWSEPTSTVNVYEEIKIPLMKINYTPTQMTEYNQKNNGIVIAFDKASFTDMRPIENSGDSSDSDTSDDSESDKYVHNVWIATNVPDFVNLNILLKYLRPFVTDPNVKGPLNFNGVKNKVPYPHINIRKNKNNKKMVFVTFNPDSTDGQFALYMCRQLKIENNGNKAVLYFKHLIRKSD